MFAESMCQFDLLTFLGPAMSMATATCCKRLAVLSRNLVSTTYQVHRRRLAATSSSAHLEGFITRVPALSRATPTTCYSTKVTAPAEEVVEQPPGFFQRAWRWLLDSDDMDTDYQMSPEERQERDEIMSKVQEMYFANPPIEPDVETYKEVMAVLIKYDDRHGVETLWRVMPEMKIEPDEELRSIVTTFLERTKDNEYIS